MDPDQHDRTYTGFDYRSLLPSTNRLEVADGSSGGGADDEDSAVCGCLPALSWRERGIGCATCVVAGYLLGLGSFWRIKDLLRGDPVPFTVNATVGNIIALMGSFFFSGPASQWRRMFRPARRNATIGYLGSLALTLLVALWGRWLQPLQGLMLLVLLGLQYVAIAWYTLSYVPYGHEAVSSLAQRWWNRNSAEY